MKNNGLKYMRIQNYEKKYRYLLFINFAPKKVGAFYTK